MKSAHCGWVPQELKDLPREQTTKSLEGKGIRIGWGKHVIIRAEERFVSNVVASWEIGDIVASYLENDDVFDSILDSSADGGEFVLYAEDRKAAFIIAYGFDDEIYKGQDCFFVKTVIGLNYSGWIGFDERQPLVVARKGQYLGCKYEDFADLRTTNSKNKGRLI